MIGTLWHMDSKRNPWLYVVVREDDSFPDFKGWLLLELLSGGQVYAYDAGDNLCLPGRDEPLYRFET